MYKKISRKLCGRILSVVLVLVLAGNVFFRNSVSVQASGNPSQNIKNSGSNFRRLLFDYILYQRAAPSALHFASA